MLADHCSNDKVSRKWSLNNTSTPTYLERRSQHRRTELRNHSKIKQKLSTKTDLIDQQLTSETKELVTDSVICTTYITTKHPNDLPSANKLNLRPTKSDSSDYNLFTRSQSVTENNNETDCHRCRSSSNSQLKRLLGFGYNPLKARSKSVPRIGFYNIGERSDRDIVSAPQPIPSSELNNSVQLLFEQKILPKRITSLRKCRRDHRKETSVFYTSLSELEQIGTEEILKITESSESVADKTEGESSEVEKLHLIETQNTKDGLVTTSEDAHSDYLLLPFHSKYRPDGQIVLDLLKTSKQFDRHCLKLKKCRSEKQHNYLSKSNRLPVGNGLAGINKSSIQADIEAVPPPRPPSHSPPPLENNIEHVSGNNEPIYETLLRNVHVPYKFSPRLPRTIVSSQLQIPSTSKQEKIIPLPQLSENTECSTEAESLAVNQQTDADYVTLIYSPNGELEKVLPITNTIDKTSCSVNLPAVNEAYAVTSKDSFLVARGEEECVRNNVVAFPSSNLHQRLDSLKCVQLCNNEEGSIHKHRSFGLQARSLLDHWRPSHVTRSPVIHLPGSAAVGERIAHVCYADPSAFLQKSQPLSLKPIVECENVSFHQNGDRHSIRACTSPLVSKKHSNDSTFDYEDRVEACLDQEFRDSAIYSDDSDRRTDISSFILCSSDKNSSNGSDVACTPSSWRL